MVEPQAARPTAKPERMASRAEISGFFSTTSYTAEQISTERSMTAPEEPRKMEATKMPLLHSLLDVGGAFPIMAQS